VAPLRLRVLGRTSLEGARGSIAGGLLDQRPGRPLKLLACVPGRSATHEEIAEALWPDGGDAASHPVRPIVRRLREGLAELAPAVDPSDVVTTSRAAYGLDTGRVWIDADAFALTIRAAAAAQLDHGGPRVEALFRRAMRLYRGDLMSEEGSADWAVRERERLRTLAEQGLRALVELCLLRGDAAGAGGYQEWLAALLPFDSDVQRRHLELLVGRGRRTEAMQRYVAFRDRLAQWFAAEPEFTPADLLADGLG
jgi:DNA-binding SARP family transcriptional activator